VRKEFPILSRTVHGRPLVYLDNANTSQKPEAVIRATDRFYRSENANIHRGTHLLSQVATEAYEGAREKVRRFLHAPAAREVVFTRGTTEAINLVAHGFAWKHLRPGDEVLISTMEHHSNIVPWQLACERSGARLVVAPIDERGDIVLEEFERLLSPRTKLVSVVHVSNALGTVNPVKAIVAMARARSVPVLLDGAQAVPHMAVDVQELGCDFYAISGHKMFGPTGIGALWGKASWLEKLPPYQGGGDMISSVTFAKTTYNELPWKFEAGTANIAGGVGLGATVDYLEGIGMGAIAAYEGDLLAYATERLSAVPELKVLGTAKEKAGVVSFTLGEIHAHDIGTILDQEGIAIRTGHHCAQPVMDRYGVPATARVSLAFYNTREEIDALVAGLAKVREVMG
jgi:cysteine desulfurase/selenocysteine lyase